MSSAPLPELPAQPVTLRTGQAVDRLTATAEKAKQYAERARSTWRSVGASLGGSSTTSSQRSPASAHRPRSRRTSPARQAIASPRPLSSATTRAAASTGSARSTASTERAAPRSAASANPPR